MTPTRPDLDAIRTVHRKEGAEGCELCALVAWVEALTELHEAVSEVAMKYDDFSQDADGLCLECTPENPAPYVAARQRVHQILRDLPPPAPR